ncbi:MAG TPA: nitroreductase/quinone reductase family protein [Acidimicrobiia bacterium]|nr:nitroreductase/quinone reductase family protein [Acidimicrobiia bacterium]
MAKQYRAPTIINKIMMLITKLGVGSTWTLVTTGRKSGEERRVPVTPIDVDGVEYLVSPYGEVGWVHNARANPEVVLVKGSHVRLVRLREKTQDAPHVVKAYWDAESFPRKFMDVPGEASVEDFAAVSGRFPVFEVDDKG